MKGAPKPAAPKSVLELILEWSAQRPAWQQDALRRIVLKGTLGDADIAVLVSLCKKGKGEAGIALSPIPLARTHLPSNPAASGSIRLNQSPTSSAPISSPLSSLPSSRRPTISTATTAPETDTRAS
jgi:hypothetical protein